MYKFLNETFDPLAPAMPFTVKLARSKFWRAKKKAQGPESISVDLIDAYTDACEDGRTKKSKASKKRLLQSHAHHRAADPASVEQSAAPGIQKSRPFASGTGSGTADRGRHGTGSSGAARGANSHARLPTPELETAFGRHLDASEKAGLATLATFAKQTLSGMGDGFSIDESYVLMVLLYKAVVVYS